MSDLAFKKRPVSPGKQVFCFLQWCHQESNRGHTDFQSDALPTELWHRHLDALVFESGCKDSMFSWIGQIFK